MRVTRISTSHKIMVHVSYKNTFVNVMVEVHVPVFGENRLDVLQISTKHFALEDILSEEEIKELKEIALKQAMNWQAQNKTLINAIGL